MCLAIEPMLIQGPGDWDLEDDDWTVRATGGGRAAHWEHSVAVTAQGLVVLTAADGGAEGLAHHGLTPAPDRSEEASCRESAAGRVVAGGCKSNAAERRR